MVGGSYEGRTQWWTAASRPRTLTCIAPFCVGGVAHRLPHGTGIPIQYFVWWMTLVPGRTNQFPGAVSWEAGMTSMPLKALADHFGLGGSAWSRFVDGRSVTSQPTRRSNLRITTVFDRSCFVSAGGMTRRRGARGKPCSVQSRSGDCRLLIGAWDHVRNFGPTARLGGIDVSSSVIDTIAYVEQFLALHLKGESNALADSPPRRIFRAGENCWDELSAWPPPDAVERPLYLCEGGETQMGSSTRFSTKLAMGPSRSNGYGAWRSAMAVLA